jgi:hypothetical protein
MGFNVKGSKKESVERVNFNLKDISWSITNVRVVSEHMVTFTFKMPGLSLYNMKVTESTRGDTAGQMFLSNGQSKGSDGKYYNNYALYLSDEDRERIIVAVCEEANND